MQPQNGATHRRAGPEQFTPAQNCGEKEVAQSPETSVQDSESDLGRLEGLRPLIGRTADINPFGPMRQGLIIFS